MLIGDNSTLMGFDDECRRVAGPTPWQEHFASTYAGMEADAEYVLAVDFFTGDKVFQKFDLNTLGFLSQVVTTNFTLISESQYFGVGSLDGSVMYVADSGVGGGLEIVVVDPRVGTEIHRYPTGTTPLSIPVIGLSDDGTKVHTTTQAPPDYETRIAETNVSTGVTTLLGWTLADVDAQVAGYHPTHTSEYTLERIVSLAELPGGDFLLCGLVGTSARVRRSDGHIVKFYDGAPWAWDSSRPTGFRTDHHWHGSTVSLTTELAQFCMVLSSDKQSFWVGGFAQPEPFGIALHPSGNYRRDGLPYGVEDSSSLFGIGWLVKINIATGATEAYTNFFESPFQLWNANPPAPVPVLNLGGHRNRVRRGR